MDRAVHGNRAGGGGVRWSQGNFRRPTVEVWIQKGGNREGKKNLNKKEEKKGIPHEKVSKRWFVRRRESN